VSDPNQQVHLRRLTCPILLALLIFRATSIEAHNGAVAIALPVDDIIVDGDLSDWPDDLMGYPVAVAAAGSDAHNHEDFQAFFRVGYSAAENSLYIGIEVEDESTIIDSSAARDWDTEDGCEIYVDLAHGDNSFARQHVIRGSGLGAPSEDGDGEAYVRWRRQEGRHQYEWKISLAGLGHSPVGSGRTISVDVVVCDKDADGSYSWMAWGKNEAKTDNPDRRGDVILLPPSTETGRVGGRIQWHRDGRPISGAHVRLRSVANPEVWTRLETDMAGAYTVELPTGGYDVSVELGHGENTTRRVEVRTGALARADLMVEPTDGERVVRGPGTTVPADGIRERTWSSFGATDGLGNGSVTALSQDDEGYLWIGTQGGLVRYDGVAFTNYTTRDGLVNDEINALLRDREGDLWIGTQGGLIRFDGESFVNYTTRDGLVDVQVYDLLLDHRGQIWVNTQGGLSRFDGHQFTNLSALPGLHESVQALLEDRQGRMWISALGKLWRFDGKRLIPFDEPLGTGNVGALFEDSGGGLWVEVDEGLILVNDVDRPRRRLKLKQGERVQAVTEDRQGRMWIATVESGSAASASSRLFRYDGQKLTDFSDVVDLATVRSLLEDREGNVWIGTSSRLVRYDAGDVTQFDGRHGVPGDISSLAEDRSGNLWIGTDAGLVRYDGLEFTTFTADDDLPSDAVRELLVDRHGAVWASTSGAGVVRYDGAGFTSFTSSDGLSHNNAGFMAETRDGVLWFATAGGGITRYDGRDFSSLTTADGLPSNSVGAVVQDTLGRLWCTTWGSGISRYDGVQVKTFTTDDGLVHNATQRLVVDDQNNLWIGTTNGLSRFDGVGFTSFSTAEGLVHSLIQTFEVDRRGHLWIGTEGGISRYDGVTFQSLLNRDRLGAPSITALLEDRNGEMWIAVRGRGLIRYRPSRSPPPVRITEVVSDRRHGPVTRLRLPSTQPLVAFEFRGLSFKTPPANMRYRYRLAGYERGWQVTRAPRVEYLNLPRGDYTFEVEAIDRDLDRSVEAARVVLQIHWPYGQIALWGSLVGASLLAVLLGGRAYRQRHRTTRLRQQQLAHFRVRDRVWEMQFAGDIEQVIAAVGDTLQDMDITFEFFGANVVEAEETQLRTYTMTRDGE